jgi:hypothetical protein
MAVDLTMSETINGAAVADGLNGGGTGVDMGQTANNSYAPIINKSANTGKKDLYLRHNAVTDPISSFGVYMQQYGLVTGFGYGGADSALNDFNTLQGLGAASGVSKNNADGGSGGVWMDMDADVSSTNQFDAATRPDLVKTFGKAGQGVSLATLFILDAEAMVYDAPGETNASAPIDGWLGKAGDTVLGDNAHLAFRVYIPNSFLNSGVIQWEHVFTYAFTG